MTDQDLKTFYQLKTLDPRSYAGDSLEQLDFEYDADLSRQYDLLQRLIDSDNTATGILAGQERRDDVEPLGFNESMVEELLENDVIDDSRDPAKRKYFVGSETFDPEAYLALQQVRSRTELYGRLEALETDIEGRQQALHDVLHAEFRRFVSVKNALGDTMDRFDKSRDFKSFEVLGEGLRAAALESDSILTPAVDAKAKGSALKSALAFVGEHKFLFNLPQSLRTDIRLKDYDSLIYDYSKGRFQHAEVLDQLEQRQEAASNVALLNRIWAEVEATVNEYKKLTWEKLTGIGIGNLGTATYNIAMNTDNDRNYIALIYKLLELDVEDNPIVEFVNVQYHGILAEIEAAYESYTRDIAVLRRDIVSTYSLESASPLSFLVRMVRDGVPLAGALQGPPRAPAAPLKGPAKAAGLPTELPLVAEFWALVQQFVDNFAVLIAKIVKFSSIVDFVVEGNFLTQHTEYKARRAGSEYQLHDASIERHLRLENYEIKKMSEQSEKLILEVCDGLISFFAPVPSVPSAKEFGFVPPFANAVSASVHNSAVYKSVSDKFQMLVESKTSLSKNANVVEALRSTCVKVNQALQSSVTSLLVEDMRNSYVLDLEGDVSLIALVEAYYDLYIRTASHCVYQQDVKNNFNIQPSRKLLASFESSFLKSLKYFVESNLKHHLVDGGDDAAKYKVLMNFDDLKHRIRSGVVAKYDEFFHASIAQQDLDIYQILDTLTAEVFESLVAPVAATITAIFNANSRALVAGSTPPAGASTPIREVIAVLVATRVKTIEMKVPKHLTAKILSRLIAHTLGKLQDLVKANSHGLEQPVVDLRYFEHYFHDQISQDQALTADVDRLYGILGHKIDLRTAMSELDGVVERALQQSRVELQSA